MVCRRRAFLCLHSFVKRTVKLATTALHRAVSRWQYEPILCLCSLGFELHATKERQAVEPKLHFCLPHSHSICTVMVTKTKT